MRRTDCDVVIVGAGFAGAAAAKRLSGLGFRTHIVEARDRVGGRALSRPFGASGELIEFGGSWITPWQQRIRHHAAQHGVKLRPRIEVSDRLWHDGTALRRNGPSPGADGYDEGMARIRRDALRYGAGERVSEDGSSLVSMTLNCYLGRIGASGPVRSQVMAWWAISGNGDPAVVSAAEFLASSAYGGGEPEGMLDKLHDTLAPGASVLVERMIEGSGAALDLDWPAACVQQGADGMTVTARDGRQVSARFAIMAAPLNTLAHIEFEPRLSSAKAFAAARRHAGASVKIWMKSRGIRPGTLATGGNGALPWMFCERETADGAVLVVGFGLAQSHFNPCRRLDILDALHSLFPGAELIGWSGHDWVSDPYSQGTWVALPADAATMADPVHWRPEGRITFAGSDIAAHEPGWFEAAIASGEEAAAAAATALSTNERISL